MSTAHTPGRIVLSPIGHLRLADEVAPLRLADGPAGGADHAEALANSRRIVALWNACRGLDTAEMEHLAGLEPYRRLAVLSAAAGALAALAIRERVAEPWPSTRPLQAGALDADRPTSGAQWDGC